MGNWCWSRFHFHSSTAQNRQGAMKMVTSTLKTMPPTDGMAIGFITSEPRPVAQKMGIKPKMVVEIVIKLGPIRFKPACTTASRRPPPS